MVLDLPTEGSTIELSAYETLTAVDNLTRLSLEEAGRVLGFNPFLPRGSEFRIQDERTHISRAFGIGSSVLILYFTTVNGQEVEVRQAAGELRTLPPKPVGLTSQFVNGFRIELWSDSEQSYLTFAPIDKADGPELSGMAITENSNRGDLIRFVQVLD